MKRPWITLLAIMLACGVALAQSGQQVAQDHFKRGNTAYNLARFDEAVEEFTKAYEAWPQPAFLYNIAQAYRLSGNCKQALYFYKRFRALKDRDTVHPLGADKSEELERFITQLTECAAKAERSAVAQPDTIDRPEPASTSPAVTTPAAEEDEGDEGDEEQTLEDEAPQPSSHRSLKLAGLATAGAGVGLVLTGAAFGMLARSAQSDVESAVANGSPYDPDRDAAGRRDATISVVTLGVGAAAVVAGGVMYFLAARSDTQSTATARLRLIPNVGAEQAGLTLDVRY